MASSLALRRATATGLVNRLGNPMPTASVVPSIARCFYTDSSIAVDRRQDRSVFRRRDSIPSLFSDVFDPFSPTRSLSQVLNLMDQFMENPFLVTSRGMGAESRREWNVKEGNEALFLRVDMPGLDKENVMVSVEKNTLIIKGEREKDEEYGPRYSSRLHLPPSIYKIDLIEAEMKNGVLKVMVPKVKEEQRKNVFGVKVDSAEDRRRRSMVLRKTTALFYSGHV